MFLKRSLCLICLAGMLFFGIISASLACMGPKIIYNDDFTERDAGWFIQPADVASGKVTVGEGRVRIKQEAEKGYTTLNLAFGLPADTDICVKARIVETTDMSKAGIGLVFWAKGFDDSYLFQMTGNGFYSVSHWADRAWQSITPTASATAFQSRVDQDNLLRVVTKGQTVTLFVNDEQVAKFRVPTPTGLVKAGFRVSAFGKDPIAVEFRDFVVTSVP
jgi:hypothetical protein